MMWWWADGSWTSGWWPGFATVLMVVCVVMMVRMMGHRGMPGSRHGNAHGHRREAPEDTLAYRLVRGEIDVDEYARLLEAIRQPTGSTGE